MSHWVNYGVLLSDVEKKEEIVTELENLGLELYGNQENKVKGSASDVGLEELEECLRPFFSDIKRVIKVDANDTSDTANGIVYKIENGSFETVKTEFSGGENSRYDWPGISSKGLRVSGGKYY